MTHSSHATSAHVPLHSVAHARAGDKGNRLNVCVMPYNPQAFEALSQQLTPERVLQAYAHRGATSVKRYDLPLLPAFNFVIDNVLEGGVNGSLNLDGHGKSNSFILLGLTVDVLPEWIMANAFTTHNRRL
ncbi:MAG: hypothetical protein RJA69_1226 [Pseudomonadota bacterium]|jgi:hypothetical protein